MHTLTFLGGYRTSLMKVISPDNVHPYPNVKNFTSFTETVSSIREMRDCLMQHGRHGQCLLKGDLERPLKNESRKGIAKKDAPSRLFVLDIDGFRAKGYVHGSEHSAASIAAVAESVLGLLPSAFQRASYVVQPSSSYGLKKETVSMHFFFMLDEPVHPTKIKNYLLLLNLTCEKFAEQITLSASGSALSYRIDPSMADNTRLIYLTPPVFNGMDDPIKDKEARFIYVEKQKEYLSAEPFLAAEEAKINLLKNKTLKAAREIAGLPSIIPKAHRITVGQNTVEVISSPGALKMTFYADTGDFVTYDVNGGDSHAYYVFKYNPTVVYNFKGEPNFLFEAADPETYAWHRQTFLQTEAAIEDVTKKNLTVPPEPLVFRDFVTDQYLNGLINPVTGEVISIATANRSGLKGLEDFMAQHGGVLPENIPVWTYEFNPKSNVVVDFPNKFLNRYQPPEIYEKASKIEITELHLNCPTISKLIMSVVGNDPECYFRFLNWLAFIVQYKEKTNTAWIFQGVQGTGKGQLYSRVLTPLLGPAYTRMMTLENVEEQFNGYLQDNLLLVVDEFRLQDSRVYDKLMNKIKNIITEPRINIRKMHTNAFEVPSYSNVLFFSNMHDVIRIEETDRRFNVAPRQETPLLIRHPELANNLIDSLEEELLPFVAHMLRYKVDVSKAKSVLNNDAKKAMHALSVNSVQQIADAFRHGDMEFFIEYVMNRDTLDNQFVLPGQNIIKGILMHYDSGSEDGYKLRSNEANILYAAITGVRENNIKFGRMMGLHGLRTEQFRYLGETGKGYKINWVLKTMNVVELRAKYCKDMMKPGPVRSIPPQESIAHEQ